MTEASNPNIQVGQVLRNLPLDYLISRPLMAACDAQTKLANTSLAFIDSVAQDANGNVRMFPLATSTTTTNPDTGISTTITKEVSVPLLTMVNLPCMYIQKVDIDLVVTVDAMSNQTAVDQTQSNSQLGVNAGAKYSIGGFSASASVDYRASCALSSQSIIKNNLSTQATYTMHIEAENQKPPGLNKILDFLVAV